MPKGWLEVGPSWIAGMFGLKATGDARVDILTGKLHVEVEDPNIKEGQVVEGLANVFTGRAIMPTGWKPMRDKHGPV